MWGDKKKMTKIFPNDVCWCGSQQKYKKCHMGFDHMLAMKKREKYEIPTHDMIKNQQQVEAIRESAKRNIEILDYVSEHIQEGMSAEDIDRLVVEKTKQLGAIAATLHYEGYPKSVCTSMNDVVCHGIPSKTQILRSGDIITVDASTIYNGFFSDSARMFMIGDVKPEVERLVRVAKESLEVGLKQVIPWKPLGDMGDAIHQFVKGNGYSVVREIGGHGVGLEFHEEPWVSYVEKPGKGTIMAPGMIFTIEPMINMGKADVVMDDEDGWTIYTEDGLPSAQWEIMVLVTEDGHEVLAY